MLNQRNPFFRRLWKSEPEQVRYFSLSWCRFRLKANTSDHSSASGEKLNATPGAMLAPYLAHSAHVAPLITYFHVLLSTRFLYMVHIRRLTCKVVCLFGFLEM